MATTRTKVTGFMAAAVLAAAAAIGAHYEGHRNDAYADVGGIPTICYGHTQGVTAGQHADDAQCQAWLQADMADALNHVQHCIHVPLAMGPLVAFTDAAYNAGPAIVCGSTLQRKANAGDITGACNELPRWVHAGGKVQPGLVKRRATERDICLGVPTS